MKKNIEENEEEKKDETEGNTITRKEAIKKVGYFAVSSATMMILLSNPDKAQAQDPGASPAALPGEGEGEWE